MVVGEFDAGPDHTIVVYAPPDLSTKAVAVVYERWPGVPG